VTVNSTRGNKDFDEGGSSVYQCTGCLTDSNSFEPRDAVKGDVARMVFYMAIRYEGDDGFPDLELNDLTNGTVPLLGRISVLLQWNAEDGVSSFEMRRNDLIHSNWQGNRNPFIDHPEWATAIWAA
jgi:endonuclease I